MTFRLWRCFFLMRLHNQYSTQPNPTLSLQTQTFKSPFRLLDKQASLLPRNNSQLTPHTMQYRATAYNTHMMERTHVPRRTC